MSKSRKNARINSERAPRESRANRSGNIDGESRRQVREELLTNILVEAGAGSGKTQMLAERMAAGVAAGVYHVEHMAAVTFTRRAASELRGRFHLALERELARAREAGPGDGSDPERIARVSSALSNLERFFAGTIHSFCARLLRERPVESRVSPGFTELDEVQDLELRRRAWREFITRARADGDPDMLALLETDVRPQDLDAAFATVCVNDDVEFPPGEAECPDPRPAWKALEKFWKELQKHLPAAVNPQTTCKIQRAAVEFKDLLQVSRYRLDRPPVMASLLETWDVESRITQKFWADSAAEKKRLRDLIHGLHQQFQTDVVAPYLAQWRQYIYRLAVTLLTRARAAAETERRRLNTLNYGDLLNLTARVLRDNEPVRIALQQKFRHILVDEFQDTDPVQAEIVFWLADEGTAHPVTDWRKVRLRPGALFVVGDPKQSIYRFRRADIDIYNIVRERFSDPAVGRVVPLTMNFRSARQLCTWANEVFQTRFPAEPTAHAPRFAALDASEHNTATGGVLTLTHECDRKEVHAEDAQRIATYIRSEVDGRWRRFSDFLILTRRKGDRIGPYAHALESLNIPVEVSGAGAFGGSAEVETLTALLRALADPQDAVSLVAVLRGPLFGISDPDLFAFKQGGGWLSVFSKPDAAASTPLTRAQAALAALHTYYYWTRILPAPAALDRILEDTGYLALTATTPGGADAGDVLHAVDRVRQVVEEGGSLADAADALEADSDAAASEVESLPLEPGRTDVVRVMNLHKAKGLEADVVFLADPTGGFPLRVDAHIERTGNNAKGWFKLVKKLEGKSWGATLLGEHVDWPQHEIAEQPYRAAEEDRLLYVAATRARKLLVVSRWSGNEKEEAWGVLNNFLGRARELAVPGSAHPQRVEPLDCSSETQALSNQARAAAHQSVHQSSWGIASVTAEARHIARMTRSADAAADDPTRVVGTDTPAHRADAGMAWGTLIHGLLEHAMRHRSATREDLRRLAMWLTVEEPQLRTVIEEALDTVAAVARLECWKEASAATEIHVEVPFVVADPESAARRSLVSGVIDLAYKHGEWHVVDYKTDRDSERADDVYAGQLSRYQEAWGKVTGAGTVQTQLIKARIA